MARRTLARTVELSGAGLHTGAHTVVRLDPAESGSGIRFQPSQNFRDCQPVRFFVHQG